MRKKIIGILICMLLIANVSVVLGVSEEKTTSIEKTESFVFVNPFGQEDVKYVISDTSIEIGTPRENVGGTYVNLVPNPSFEEGDTMPTGWTYTDYPDNNVIHIWDSSDAHSGDKSIGISCNNNAQNWSSSEIWYTTDYIPVDLVNHNYELSTWVKFPNELPNQLAWVGIGLYDINKTQVSRYHSFGFLMPYTSEWKYGRMDTNWIKSIYRNTTKYVEIHLFQLASDPTVLARFDDVFFGYLENNNPPNKPAKPSGQIKGKPGLYYSYSTSATDPDNDILYYNFSWGDGTYNDWVGPYYPGEIANVSHNWTNTGSYNIKVKVSDSLLGGESEWSDPLPITMPYTYKPPLIQFLDWLFQRFPHAFPILRQLLGY